VGGMKYDLSNHGFQEYDLAKCVVEVLYGVLAATPA